MITKQTIHLLVLGLILGVFGGVVNTFFMYPQAQNSEDDQEILEEQVKVSTPNVKIEEFGDNLKVSGTKVFLTQDIKGDLFVSGESIDIQEDVKDDLFALGGKISLQEDVKDNAYIMGNTVRILEDLENAMIAAHTVEINGDVDGDLWIGAEFVIINGNIKNDARIAASHVFINSSKVNGNLIVYTNDFNINPDTETSGYVSIKTQENTFTDTTRFANSKMKIESIEDLKSTFPSYKEGVFFNSGTVRNNIDNVLGLTNFLGSLLSILSALISLFVIAYFFPEVKNKIATNMSLKSENILQNLLYGTLTILGSSILLFVSTISVVGWGLLWLLLPLMILGYTLSHYIAIYKIGEIAAKPFNQTEKTFIPIILGVIIYNLLFFILGFIPGLGTIIYLLLITFATGATIKLKYNKKEKKQ